MKHIEIVVNGKNIKLYGKPETIESEKRVIENLYLTGNEYEDRLIIQKAIDEHKLKSDILYDGNTVYPFEKIVKLYRKLQKSGSLEKMTKEMYHFFTNACGDIAHYNFEGFKSYYNYSVRRLEEETLKYSVNSSRFTDRDKIFKELKIGRDYYYLRENIDINKVKLNKLKGIIKECGWDITEKDKYWRIERNTEYNNKFGFEVDISSKSALSVIEGIINYNNIFDKNNYIEERVDHRKESSNPLSVSEIVYESNNIKSMLYKLADNVLYKSRIEADDLEHKEIEKQENIDYEF